MRATLEQIIHFQTHGYVIVENVLTNDDLQPVIDEINEQIDRKAQILYNEGKIKELHTDKSFERRYAELYWQCPEIYEDMDIIQSRGQAMFQFLQNDNLLDIVECFIGSDISCNPIQHLRHKLPQQPGVANTSFNGNVPWHQDVAVTHPDSDPSEIITFWLPLVDATRETGCMEIIPDVFRQGYMKHITGPIGSTVDPDVLPAHPPIVAECPKGGIVIMNKYTPHRSTDNISDRIRWSLDLRYHKTGAHSGRESQPSFVVRPKSEAVLTHAQWDRKWQEALDNPQTKSFHRV